CEISDEALTLMGSYPWPGNLNELKNVLERIIVLKTEGLIGVEDLPHSLFQGQKDFEFQHLQKLVDDLEVKFIKKALIRCNGNKKKASDLLGLNRTTLIEKMKKRQIPLDFPSHQ